MRRGWILILLLGFVAACSQGTADTTTVPTTEASSSSSTEVAPTSTSVATTSMPATTAVETTSTSGPSEPIERGLSVYVVGRDECRFIPMAVEPIETRLDDGTIQSRDGEFVCEVESNDPRVAGTGYFTLNQNVWGTGPSKASLVQWGTIRIENDGGAWETEYVGVYTSETGDVGASLFTGTGSYDGLSYYRWSVETFGSSWDTKGLIFPRISNP